MDNSANILRDNTFDQNEGPTRVGIIGILGVEYPINSGSNIIGRDRRICNVVLDLNTVSKRHASITFTSRENVMLMDLNSSNKTKLLGVTLNPYIAYPIKHGDIFQLGDVFAVLIITPDDDLPLTQILHGDKFPAHKRMRLSKDAMRTSANKDKPSDQCNYTNSVIPDNSLVPMTSVIPENSLVPMNNVVPVSSIVVPDYDFDINRQTYYDNYTVGYGGFDMYSSLDSVNRLRDIEISTGYGANFVTEEYTMSKETNTNPRKRHAETGHDDMENIIINAEAIVSTSLGKTQTCSRNENNIITGQQVDNNDMAKNVDEWDIDNLASEVLQEFIPEISTQIEPIQYPTEEFTRPIKVPVSNSEKPDNFVPSKSSPVKKTFENIQGNDPESSGFQKSPSCNIEDNKTISKKSPSPSRGNLCDSLNTTNVETPITAIDLTVGEEIMSYDDKIPENPRKQNGKNVIPPTLSSTNLNEPTTLHKPGIDSRLTRSFSKDQSSQKSDLDKKSDNNKNEKLLNKERNTTFIITRTNENKSNSAENATNNGVNSVNSTKEQQSSVNLKCTSRPEEENKGGTSKNDNEIVSLKKNETDTSINKINTSKGPICVLKENDRIDIKSLNKADVKQKISSDKHVQSIDKLHQDKKQKKKDEKSEGNTAPSVSSSNANNSGMEIAVADEEPAIAKQPKIKIISNVPITLRSRTLTLQRILYTAFEHESFKIQFEKLGVTTVTNVMQCTVVVSSKIVRTVKFLCAVGLGLPIVGVNWMEKCIKDKRIFVIVKCSGGIWQEGGPQWICVSTSRDKALWPDLKQKGATIVSMDFILNGVVTQTVDKENNKLK